MIQDEVFSEEIKENGAATSEPVPFPLKKFLATVPLEREKYAGSCRRDLYHYSRVLEKHVLEIVVETSLSLIRKEQLQEANDVCGFFFIRLIFMTNILKFISNPKSEQSILVIYFFFYIFDVLLFEACFFLVHLYSKVHTVHTSNYYFKFFCCC